MARTDRRPRTDACWGQRESDSHSDEVAPSSGVVSSEPGADAWLAAALTAALDAVVGAAFVVGPGGRVLHASRRGRALLRVDRSATLRRVDASQQRTPIAAPGDRGLEIVVLERTSEDAADRARSLRRALSLTAREVEVLALVAQGRSNRSIGEELGCTEKTIEIHVSRILAATGCATRASVVAQFWTGTLGGS